MQINDDSINKLAELHEAAFAWAVRCSNGDRHEAEEVLQCVYLKILEGKTHFEERSTLKTWLFGIIRNTALERRRKRLRQRILLFQWSQQEKDTSTNHASPEDNPEDRSEEISLLLASLSTRQREVLELVFYHELTVEEAASVLKISLGSARTHYHRGKQAMLKRLQPQELT